MFELSKGVVLEHLVVVVAVHTASQENEMSVRGEVKILLHGLFRIRFRFVHSGPKSPNKVSFS